MGLVKIGFLIGDSAAWLAWALFADAQTVMI